MPYPKHNRFVVRGNFGTSGEEWSYGLKFTSDVTAGADVLPQDWDVSAITGAVNNFHDNSYFATSTLVTGWRGYQIGADGRLIGDNMHREDYTTFVGGGGTTKYPPQVALVMTLAAPSRGPAHLGRCYLPGVTLAVDASTFLLSNTSGVNVVLADFKTYVEALLDAMYDSFTVGEGLVNVSPSGASGTIQEVSEYRCGRVLDTMRSRRRSLPESYEVLAA